MTRLAMDGIALPHDARHLVAEQGATVHARVGAFGQPRRTACGHGLGAWWSGVPDDVTCPDCLATLAGGDTPG